MKAGDGATVVGTSTTPGHTDWYNTVTW